MNSTDSETANGPPIPRWWLYLNFAVIAASAVMVLVPGIRRAPPFMIAFGVLGAAFLWGAIKRVKADGGDRPIRQMYEEVKQGRRRLRTEPVEWAAIAALALAAYLAR